VRSKLPVLLPLLALAGGCAGHASDYWRPKASLIAEQLPRYGLTGAAGECMTRELTGRLTVRQLSDLADRAARAVAGGPNPAALGPRELGYVAGLLKNPEVGAETGRALEACGLAGTSAAGTAEPASPEPAPTESTPSAAAAGAAPLWLNLGTAATGQAIAVDATSVATGPDSRQGWFRLSNPGEAAAGDIGYLLRVDCAGQSITALGGRKYAPGGALVEQRDYPQPEGPLAIEAGTVMEIAFRALCT
jgi:hypothetical protein